MDRAWCTHFDITLYIHEAFRQLIRAIVYISQKKIRTSIRLMKKGLFEISTLKNFLGDTPLWKASPKGFNFTDLCNNWFSFYAFLIKKKRSKATRKCRIGGIKKCLNNLVSKYRPWVC